MSSCLKHPCVVVVNILLIKNKILLFQEFFYIVVGPLQKDIFKISSKYYQFAFFFSFFRNFVVNLDTGGMFIFLRMSQLSTVLHCCIYIYINISGFFLTLLCVATFRIGYLMVLVIVRLSSETVTERILCTNSLLNAFAE